MSKSSHTPDNSDHTLDDFGKKHPGLAEITFVGDDRPLRGRIRQHLRNPPMRTIFLIALVVASIPIYIVYPKVSKVAQENWSVVELRRERHFVNVTAASWIYPFLRMQATRMQSAEVPIEWRGVSFKHGPCLPEHMSQLPVGKYAYAIETACKNLDKIQMTYASDCAQTSDCIIPNEAVVELQIVLDRLKVAFSDAGFGIQVDDQEQIHE